MKSQFTTIKSKVTSDKHLQGESRDERERAASTLRLSWEDSHPDGQRRLGGSEPWAKAQPSRGHAGEESWLRYHEEAQGCSSALRRTVCALVPILRARPEKPGVQWMTSHWLHGEGHVVCCQDNFTTTSKERLKKTLTHNTTYLM